MKKNKTDEIKTLEDNWKRALADYQNLSRRVSEDRIQYVKLANVNLLAKLIPSLDIMELAAGHSNDLGVQMAAKQFTEVLKSEDVEVILPNPGDVFDQAFHECIEALDLTEGHVENTIAEVNLKGYRVGNYVLRPARVKVYKAKLALDN